MATFSVDSLDNIFALLQFDQPLKSNTNKSNKKDKVIESLFDIQIKSIGKLFVNCKVGPRKARSRSVCSDTNV